MSKCKYCEGTGLVYVGDCMAREDGQVPDEWSKEEGIADVLAEIDRLRPVATADLLAKVIGHLDALLEAGFKVWNEGCPHCFHCGSPLDFGADHNPGCSYMTAKAFRESLNAVPPHSSPAS